MDASTEANRRPIRARSSAWARRAAARLAASGATPNQISLASIVVACAAAAALLAVPGWLGLVLCALGIQLRLLCNLLDGMVAIEHGQQSALGALYNDMPDRITDTVLLVALGYAATVPWLGWFAALAAVLTAYVRMVGGALGYPQDFRGPMAKAHRMAVMTAACLLGAIESAASGTRYALLISAVTIAIGSLLTCATRTRAIVAALQRH